MNKGETLILILAIALMLFGLMMVTGSALNMAGGDPDHTLTWHMLVGALLGVLPLLGGLALCRRMLARGRAALGIPGGDSAPGDVGPYGGEGGGRREYDAGGRKRAYEPRRSRE